MYYVRNKTLIRKYIAVAVYRHLLGCETKERKTVMPNTHRRRDSTRQLRRVGVSGVYWA